VFGVLNLIEVEGHWPAALQDYSLPENNGLTGRGVFDPRVFVSRSPIVREMTRIADLYFDSDAASEMRIWPFPAFRASEPLIAVSRSSSRVVQSGNSRHFRRDHLHPPRLLQALQEMNASVFWAKLLFAHALAFHLHRHGGH